MSITRKILGKPYRLTVKTAKKLTNFDQVFVDNQNLRIEIQDLKSQNNILLDKQKLLEDDYNFGHPKGHYYSPVHSVEDLKKYSEVVNRSKNKFMDTIPGFSKERILQELDRIEPYFKEFAFPKKENRKYRFYVENDSLSLLDSLLIFSMIRRYKPERIIEIGSGYSSALMMDVNDMFFKNKIDITFIEPYTQTLYGRMRKADKSKYRVIPEGVQNVSLEVFKKLKKDDILFIDSTHVSKFGSDVNYEIFDILPELNKGVIIHFHDIGDGFEYFYNWLKMGWAWNEAYILRSFLMNNNEYEILLMTDYIAGRYQKLLKKKYPGGDGLFGGSLWMRKLS